MVSEGKMSFQFCAPKEKNEIEEEDEIFFSRFLKEEIRSCFVNEVEEEKL